MKKFVCPIPAALLLLVLTSTSVWAHGMSIFAYVDNQVVYTESYFSNGQAVRQGRVLVFDSERNPLLEGETDDEGLFDFPVPKIDDLTLVIEAGMGHKAVFVLEKSAVQE
ncbi:nickel transport protein [Geoalkalibacter ferrihydriticus]|uniref:Nickel transport protein n=2 Tax=Geoalkalibacter ferrihydriticus TaxID=392333 RepID=A0A0C2HU16_9BACT|nr:hypothetical protein [Geoalkalibacter ferrihydriticus]KIH76312.1 hypothetical protein GFER_11950 [Geoalkalibacter ferrihydriticus DSM 17813]SDL21399.1 nickel transport protein [Geoalkalibacter ferrihydriticus]